MGLRILARQAGVLKGIHTDGVRNDPRVGQVFIKVAVNRKIMLPPADYNAWVLGHILFTPDEKMEIEAQCRFFLAKTVITMQPFGHGKE